MIEGVEIWKAIEGYEGLYEVSSYGRVKSLKRERVIILKPGIRSTGHLCVNLYKNNHRFNYTVHRLVAKTFISLDKYRGYVNHLDGNKQNSRCDNLEWVTSSENQLHAYQVGLRKRPLGIDNPNSKLTKDDISQIKYLYGHFTEKELAAIYGVSRVNISNIHHGKSWKHLHL